jgi:N-acetylglucosaminyldiphosphoundecaprenol N-acetyl-beta-D-mannosaminyltransferase
MKSPTTNASASSGPRTLGVLGTPLLLTSYAGMTEFCRTLKTRDRCIAVDLTNTHIVTMRRHDVAFRELTADFDYFVPDAMPLIWLLNAQGGGMRDRIYGPIFMRHCLTTQPGVGTHYFLGASEACLQKLQENLRRQHPALEIVGARNGYFSAADELEILAEINRLSPDFIWVGLGTPKQQAWIKRHKSLIKRGVVLAVGFAFDVNAGTKKDAPMWMQRFGLTWLFRVLSEPRRLLGRYVRYNSLFLFYLAWDGVRGRAFASRLPEVAAKAG